MNYKDIALIGIGSLMLLSSPQAKAQTPITQWNFENLPADPGGSSPILNSSPAPSTGTGTATSLGMTNTYTVGGSPNTSTDSSDIKVSTTAPDTTQVWRIVGTNGWNYAAPIGTQGAQFSASTVGMSNIALTFDIDITAQGEANLQVQYTTNGTTWNNTPAADFTSLGIVNAADGIFAADTNTTSSNTVTGGYLSAAGKAVGNTDTFFQGVTANFSSIAGANNDANFGVRIVNASMGTDDVALKTSSGNSVEINNTSGNWRFDNVTISGTAAVPEPSSWALAIIAAGVVVVMRRRAARLF